MHFVLIGANDVLHEGVRRGPPEIAGRVARAAARLAALAALDETPVHVVSLLPTARPRANETIRRTNELLAAAAEEGGFGFLDVHGRFAGDAGLLRPELTVDGVHLSPPGMALLADRLARACPDLGPSPRID